MRVGFGHDIHRLTSAAGGRLMLGGVVVSESVSAVAHSDGDVLLHALTDALLGAIGGGDIGEHFPPSDPQWQDAASHQFVAEAMRRVREGGFAVSNADCHVLLERPKLRPHKAAIEASVSGMIDAPVNVKAGTMEGMDAIGRGEAIVAQVVVLLHKA